MSPRILALTLALALFPAAATDVEAQTSHRFSLDATAGKGFGRATGSFEGGRSGFAGDLLVAARLHALGGGSLVAGMSASAQGSGASTMICRAEPGAECAPNFPSFFLFTPSLGWESRDAGLRILAGPALVQTDFDGERAVGIQARIDMATAMTDHFAMVASIRPAIIPNYLGERVGLLGFGVGFRLR